MIEILKVNGALAAENPKLKKILSRDVGLNNEIMTRTDAIIREIRERGDAAPERASLIAWSMRCAGTHDLPPIRASITRSMSPTSATRLAAITEAATSAAQICVVCP